MYAIQIAEYHLFPFISIAVLFVLLGVCFVIFAVCSCIVVVLYSYRSRSIDYQFIIDLLSAVVLWDLT